MSRRPPIQRSSANEFRHVSRIQSNELVASSPTSWSHPVQRVGRIQSNELVASSPTSWSHPVQRVGRIQSNELVASSPTSWSHPVQRVGRIQSNELVASSPTSWSHFRKFESMIDDTSLSETNYNQMNQLILRMRLNYVVFTFKHHCWNQPKVRPPGYRLSSGCYVEGWPELSGRLRARPVGVESDR